MYVLNFYRKYCTLDVSLIHSAHFYNLQIIVNSCRRILLLGTRRDTPIRYAWIWIISPSASLNPAAFELTWQNFQSNSRRGVFQRQKLSWNSYYIYSWRAAAMKKVRVYVTRNFAIVTSLCYFSLDCELFPCSFFILLFFNTFCWRFLFRD